MDRHLDARHQDQDDDDRNHNGRNRLGSWPQATSGAPQAEQQVAQQGSFWPAAQVYARARRPDEPYYDDRPGYQRQRTEGATEYASGAGAAPGGFYASQFGAVSTHQHALPIGALEYPDARGISAEAAHMAQPMQQVSQPAHSNWRHA